jgi:hypothetical protein
MYVYAKNVQEPLYFTTFHAPSPFIFPRLPSFRFPLLSHIYHQKGKRCLLFIINIHKVIGGSSFVLSMNSDRFQTDSHKIFPKLETKWSCIHG